MQMRHFCRCSSCHPKLSRAPNDLVSLLLLVSLLFLPILGFNFSLLLPSSDSSQHTGRDPFDRDGLVGVDARRRPSTTVNEHEVLTTEEIWNTAEALQMHRLALL
ncbi:uncharacterized protein BDV17DRAFT_278308 [Aspergillus undulatus]|uniref:uncharacterized protein n=1 Tax=Aspergillus undulatus TaxID=1810928 RepID=UPI003CCD9763